MNHLAIFNYQKQWPLQLSNSNTGIQHREAIHSLPRNHFIPLLYPTGPFRRLRDRASTHQTYPLIQDIKFRFLNHVQNQPGSSPNLESDHKHTKTKAKSQHRKPPTLQKRNYLFFPPIPTSKQQETLPQRFTQHIPQTSPPRPKNSKAPAKSISRPPT